MKLRHNKKFLGQRSFTPLDIKPEKCLHSLFSARLKIKAPNKAHCHKYLTGFTLLELLIVLGILAILAVIVLLVINPAEYLRRSRDVKRQTDLQTLNSAINFSQAIDFGLPLGAASTVYVSLPDASTTCGSWGLPSLPAGWTYNCVSDANLQRTDGTGWIPVNFNSLSTGSPLANLPIDPVNASTSGLYYTYNIGSWKFTGVFESAQYQAFAQNDGGLTGGVYEVGSDIKAGPSLSRSGAPAPTSTPSPYLSVGSDCVLYHAYWDGTATDHSSYGNDGTLVNPGTPVASFGADGLVISDLASEPAGVVVPHTPSLAFTDNFSVEGWIYKKTGTRPILSSQGVGGAKDLKFNVGFLNFGGSDRPVSLHQADGEQSILVAPAIPDENFYHFVSTYSSTAGAIHFYVNGVEQVPSYYAPPTKPAPDIGSTVRVGYFDNGYIWCSPTTIGEVRLWKKVLLQSDVTSIFNATKSRYGL